jgi:hypothetical protein
MVYICLRNGPEPARRGRAMSDTGLQKVAFFVLLALIFYVAASGTG